MVTTVATHGCGLAPIAPIYPRFATVGGGVHVTVIVNNGIGLLRRSVLSPFRIGAFGMSPY
jgi:hypothetical protein